MKWKGLFIIIGIYLVIFTTIFLIFMPKNEEESDKLAKEILTEMRSDIKFRSNFITKLNPFVLISNVKLPNFLLSTHCYFRRDFKCLNFFPDKNKNEIIFHFKNVLGKDVTVMDLSIDGGINCFLEINEFVRFNSEFFIKAENCTFSDIRGDAILKYYDVSPDFYKVSKGKIVVK